jgi:hypothetical protein
MSSVVNPSATNEGINPAVLTQVQVEASDVSDVEFSRVQEKQFERWEESGFDPTELPNEFKSPGGEAEFANQYAVWAKQQGSGVDTEIGRRAAKFEEQGFTESEARQKAIDEIEDQKVSLMQADENAVAIDAIDQVIGNLGTFTGGTGLGRVLGKGIPDTAAKDIDADLDTIRAIIGFEKLQAMRSASKTGGALGQVSERENKLLQSVRGSIDAGQSTEELEKSLKKIKASLLNINNAVKYDAGDMPKKISGRDAIIEQSEFDKMVKEKGYDELDYKLALLEAGYLIK